MRATLLAAALLLTACGGGVDTSSPSYRVGEEFGAKFVAQNAFGDANAAETMCHDPSSFGFNPDDPDDFYAGCMHGAGYDE